MKCGILTFHRAINYGGVLQAYALVTVLNRLGVDAEIIDYYCPAIENLYRPKHFMNKSVIKYFLSAVIYNGTLAFNNAGFEKFRDTYMKISERKYKSLDDLDNCNLIYDLLIVGSDQVWSPTCAGMDKAYFLTFANNNIKKAAFAASFGVEKLEDRVKPFYSENLLRFDNISVREQSGRELVMDLIGKDVNVVLDPVLMLTAEEWRQQFSKPEMTIKNQYIFVYTIGESESLLEMARNMGKKMGIPVVYVNDRIRKTKGVINLRKVAPDEWFWLMSGAEIVYTNSFHGLAFCLNMKKIFFIQRLTSNKQANTRLNNYIQQFQLQDFVVNDKQDVDVLPSYPINVDYLLDMHRKKGLDFLREIYQDII